MNDENDADLEEFLDFYVEGSFAVRDAEVQFHLDIGKLLVDAPEEKVRRYAVAIHRKTGFLKDCIEVYKQWTEIEKTYHKGMSWSDILKEAGLRKPVVKRKSFRKLIQERVIKNEVAFENTGDVYVKGKYDEDKELLTVVDEKKGDNEKQGDNEKKEKN